MGDVPMPEVPSWMTDRDNAQWQPERSQTRRAARPWWAIVYAGRRDPETRREADRRRYIRRKARALGISESRAAAMTPRMPSKARRGERERNADGTFVARGARPRGRSGAPTDAPTIDARSIRRAMRLRAIAMTEAAEGRSRPETHST